MNVTPSPSPPAAPPVSAMAILALAVVVAYALVGEPWLARSGFRETSRALTGMGLLWSLVGLVGLTVRRAERLPWSSLGLRRLDRRTALLAVGLGIVLMLLVPLLTIAAQAFLPVEVGAGGGIADAAASPWWLLLLGVVTAAVCEEVLFRAYPIERHGALGAALGLAAFVLVHAGGWNPAHVVGVVLPLGAALTCLYLWRRDLGFVIVVHAVVDLPLVVLAALG